MVFNIDKSINKVLGGTSISRNFIAKKQPVMRLIPKTSSQNVSKKLSDVTPIYWFHKTTIDTNKKSKNLLNLAKGSMFFPFTQPTVKNPYSRKTIKGHQPSMNNVFKNFGLKSFGGKNDLDFDGVPNKKDCQPRNTMRQDAKPNILMRQRIEKLPIDVVEGKPIGHIEGNPYYRKEDIKELTNRLKTREGAEAKKKVYGTFKRYPGLIGVAEKTGAHIVVDPYIDESVAYSGVSRGKFQPIVGLGKSFLDKKDSKGMRGYTLAHELEHTRQLVEEPKEVREQMEKESKEEPWEFRRHEIEADKKAYQTLAEHRYKMKQPDIPGGWSQYIKRREEKDITMLEEEPKSAKGSKAVIGEMPEEQQTAAFRAVTCAPIVKQQEFQNMNEQEKDIQRITKEDTDGDLVPDEYDCQPQDASRQDTKPNILMRQRIEKLPIDVVDTELNSEDYKVRNIEEKQQTKVGIEAKKKLYGTFKRYPGLIGDIERTGTGITLDPLQEGSSAIQFEKEDKAISLGQNFLEDNSSKRFRAYVLGHELGHIHQFGEENQTIEEHKETKKEPWLFRESEIEADKYGRQIVIEHRGKVRPRNISGGWDEYIKRREEKDITLLKEKNSDSSIPRIIEEEMPEEQREEAFRAVTCAPIVKQQEFQNMNEQEKDIQRITKSDIDGDLVPDEYDCQPQDASRQDTYLGKIGLKATMYADPREPAKDAKDMYISDWQDAEEYTPEQIAGMIAHEETHNILSREQGEETSMKLDSVWTPALIRNGETLNPYTQQTYIPRTQIKKEWKEIREPGEDKWAHIRKWDKLREEKDCAPIVKQQEFQNMNEQEKDIQRITKEDTDGDLVPDEYDCEPQNKDAQDTRIYLSKRKDKDKHSMYTYPSSPKNIFIGDDYKQVNFSKDKNINVLSQVVGHEELHNVLDKDISYRSSQQLDNITTPTITYKNKFLEHSYKPKDIISVQEKKKLTKDAHSAYDFITRTPEGASLEKQNKWKNMNQQERKFARQFNKDTDGDMVPDEYDCQPENTMRQDSDYHELTDEEYRRGVLKDPKNIKTYGQVSEISGKKVGAGIVTAGIVVPGILPTPITTPLGLGVAKYVDKVRIVRTDKHDKKYKIPRIQFIGKDKKCEGASIVKQQEFQNMNEQEKDIQRITKEDTDGDLVPDEYDCVPTDASRQDSDERYLYHGTTEDKYKNIKKEGLKKFPISSEELKRFKKNREGVYLTEDMEDAQYFAKIGDATHAFEESEKLKADHEEKEFDKFQVHESFYSEEKPVVLKVKVPAKKTKAIYKASLLSPKHYIYQENIPEENITVLSKDEQDYINYIQKLEFIGDIIESREEDFERGIMDRNDEINNKFHTEDKNKYMEYYNKALELEKKLNRNELSRFKVY